MRQTPPPPGNCLVLVADSVRARLFDAADGVLAERAVFTNPEGRMHERDLVADATGRRNHRPTQGNRSAFGGQTAKRHRAEDFAGMLCDELARDLDGAGEHKLYVIAEPEFLGILRQRMSAPVSRHVAGEIPKSLADQSVERIRATLPAQL